MKHPTSLHPQRGFTLIELLVVVAIIAVLAGAGFAVGSSALNKARKLSAQNTATALDQAINAFYSEYGTFPADEEQVDTSASDGVAMLNVLLGNDPDLNPRGLVLLTAKEGKSQGSGGTDGLVYNDDNTVRGLYDPWGNGFIVEIDTAFDDYLEFTPANVQGAEQVRLNGRRVAVYSLGVPSGEQSTLKSMVKSW